MADSNITKKALADSMKILMEKEEFSKISVADICNQCGMNRKSFYYHFKDKYDLVNWIFDVEFLAILEPDLQDDPWELIDKMCFYFYENQKFYRSALKIKGQNSFEEHFIELLQPIIKTSIGDVLGEEEDVKFYMDFCQDALIGSLRRWITEKECMEPEAFLKKMKKCIHIIAIRDREFSEE